MSGLKIHIPGLSIPKINTIMSSSGTVNRVKYGEELIIKGDNLKGDNTVVKIGKVEFDPNISPNSLRNSEIKVLLDKPELRAGVCIVRVIHKVKVPNNTSEPLRNGPASNMVKIKIIPEIDQINVPVQLNAEQTEILSAKISVQVTNPQVGKDQEVNLILNQSGVDSPLSFAIPFPDRDQDTNTIEIELLDMSYEIPEGTYIARIEVDGAMSLPTMTDGVYEGPTVEVPEI